MPVTSRPKKILQYQVLDLLGKGGNGVVYKGLDMVRGTFVAIKQIIIQKTQIKNIKFEINVLKELSDPFIVKYIDAIQISNKVYLVMEYLEGGSLGSLVQKTPLEQKLVKKYIKQVLKGLEYLHKHHVAHRDMKGTNILLTKEGKAKITDFGVAIQVNDTQKTLSSAGTPYWMAPEAIVNENQTSVECDIWSLGCTVIELLTGNPPYHDMMPYPALFRIVEDLHPPLPQKISASCVDFLMKCFHKDPKKRVKASQLLKHKWIKQINQHKSSSFSVDIDNMVFENDKKIEALLKEQEWSELYQTALSTTNKKSIYYNKFFILINDTHNCDQKLKFIRELITYNYEALKYLSSIRVFSKIFHQQKKAFKITKMKVIDFIYECYEMCEQNNDLLVFLNDFLPFLEVLLEYLVVNKPQRSQRIVHIAKVEQIFFRLVNSNLLIEEHLHCILQEHSVFTHFLHLSSFILSLKNAEMTFNILSIFKANLCFSANITKYEEFIGALCDISQHFYDFRVLFTFVTLLKQLVSIKELRKLFNSTRVLEQMHRTIDKLIKIQTVTMEQHQILLEVVEFLSIYLIENSAAVKEFIRLNGIQALTSLPEIYTKNQKIHSNITSLIEIIEM